MKIFSLVSMLVFFTSMVFVGFLKASGENWKRRLVNGTKWALPIFQACLLIMVVPVMKMNNFMILYPIMLAAYLRTMNAKVYDEPQLIIGLTTSIVSILVLILSDGWLFIPLIIASSVINLIIRKRL